MRHLRQEPAATASPGAAVQVTTARSGAAPDFGAHPPSAAISTPHDEGPVPTSSQVRGSFGAEPPHRIELLSFSLRGGSGVWAGSGGVDLCRSGRRSCLVRSVLVLARSRRLAPTMAPGQGEPGLRVCDEALQPPTEQRVDGACILHDTDTRHRRALLAQGDDRRRCRAGHSCTARSSATASSQWFLACRWVRTSSTLRGGATYRLTIVRTAARATAGASQTVSAANCAAVRT